ncbi:MAG: hypothetical protein AAB423_00600 [Patescibacteria group bacterium]
MSSSVASKNCIEIIEPFVQKVAEFPEIEIQLIGGVGSAALAHPGLQIDFEGRAITAPTDLHLPQFRDDGNKRDLDVLVMSADRREVAEVEEFAEQVIGDELEISVFGLKEVSQLEAQMKNPFGLSAMKTFLSDRYVTGTSEGSEAYKALFPFQVAFNPSAMQTWNLSVGEANFPVPHPGMSIANYYTRSISGLRPKDAEKVELMAENVFAQSSETLKWLTEGDGTPFLDLANILHSLREPEEGGVELSIGGRIVITPENYRELTNNGAFAPGGVSSRVANATLAVARAKSRALHALEVNPQLVTMWQRFGEQKASFFIKNN